MMLDIIEAYAKGQRLAWKSKSSGGWNEPQLTLNFADYDYKLADVNENMLKIVEAVRSKLPIECRIISSNDWVPCDPQAVFDFQHYEYRTNIVWPKAFDGGNYLFKRNIGGWILSVEEPQLRDGRYVEKDILMVITEDYLPKILGFEPQRNFYSLREIR